MIDKDRKQDMYTEEGLRIRKERTLRAYKMIKKTVSMLFLAIMVWWAYIVGTFMGYAAISDGMDNPLIIFMWGFSLMAIMLFAYSMVKIEMEE